MLNKMILTAISTLLTMGMSQTVLAENMESQDMSQMANMKGMEKCYGIAKAGQNDCGNASHQCASESKINGDKNEWIAVPTGLCNKIVNGQTKPPQKT